MNVLTICVTAFITVVATVFLKNANSPIYIVVAAIGSSIILFSVIDNLSYLFNNFIQMASNCFFDYKYITVALKSFGILLLSSYTVNFCNDSGNSHLGLAVSFGSKVIIVILVFPLLADMLTGIIELIG